MSEVFLVYESDYDHFALKGIYDQNHREAAEKHFRTYLPKKGRFPRYIRLGVVDLNKPVDGIQDLGTRLLRESAK